MNRNATGVLWRSYGLLLLVGFVLTTAALAQENDADSGRSSKPIERSQRVFVEIGSWVAQPAGLEYTPVSRYDVNDVFGAEQIQLRQATEGETRWRLGYRFPKRHAALTVSYYSHRTGSNDADATPGRFNFGERLAAPAFAGYALDGRADAWEASSTTSLRDARLEYRQRIFASDDGIELTGAIGWGRVWHNRNQDASYYALIPDIPPLLPPLASPRSDLVPDPDTAALRSRFEGRGMTAALQLRVPLLADRLVLEAEADLAVLRGKTDTGYAGRTNYFTFEDELLEPPYDVFSQSEETAPGSGVFIPLASRIAQVSVGTGQRATAVPTTSDVMGLSLGLRWRARDWLDVFGGFRSARYTDVGIDLLPGPLAATVNDAQDYRRENRSATYEGFYVGIAFHLF